MIFLLALGYFSLLAVAFLWKLIPVWNAAIPGGLEDTRIFLWNAWWNNHALSVLHTNPFHTTMLFFPFGCSLVSHDSPLWMSLITFFGQRAGLTMIAASNLWFALSWVLLGICVFGLAREVTGESASALAAGTLAMTHSYVLARAMQNWGQFNVWAITLFLWCLVYARRRGSILSFVIAGIALAWNAACHYYFLIYSTLIWIAVIFRDLSPYSHRVGVREHFPGGIRSVLIGLSTAAAIAALGISLHPGVYPLAGHSIGLQSPVNSIFAMWVLLMLLAATYVRLEATPSTESSERRRKLLSGHMRLGVTAALFLSPLIWGAISLIRAGGYPKQSILWKTHLPGANLLAIFGPNPLQALWGPMVSLWYTTRGMNPQEQAAAIGWVCLAALLFSRAWKTGAAARRWIYLACAATILSMGTHLHIAQYNLWCPLPFFWLRLMPLVGNVRVPERWMAVGTVAWSVVFAISLMKLAADRGWSISKVSVLAIALLLFENWPGIPYRPVPTVSPIYETLRALPPGAVLPVPLYIGDSSIGTGDSEGDAFIFPWDHLWAQVHHEKPILGGFVGRISRRIIDDYKADPFIRTLLDLEERKLSGQDPQPAAGAQAIHTFQFRYVLVYPQSTNEAVLKYALGSLPLERIDQTETVQLYRVRDYRSD